MSSFTFFSSPSMTPISSTPLVSDRDDQRKSDQSDAHSHLASIARPALILIANHRYFARTLSILRTSGLFSAVILLHSEGAPESLIGAASWAMEWNSFLGVKDSQEKTGKKHDPESIKPDKDEIMKRPSRHSSPTPLSDLESLSLYTKTESEAAKSRPASKIQPFGSPLLTSWTPIINDSAMLDSGASSTWAQRAPAESRSSSSAEERRSVTPTEEIPKGQHRGSELQEFRAFLSNIHRDSPELSTAGSSSPLDQSPIGKGSFFSGGTDESPFSKGLTGGSIPSLSLPGPALSPSLSRKALITPRPSRPTSRTDNESIGSQSPISRPLSDPGRGNRQRKYNGKRLSRTQDHAVALFNKVIEECREEMIIPRESVVRSRIELHLLPKASKKGGKYLKRSSSGSLSGMGSLKVPLRFDKWLQVLEEVGVMQVEGVKPQRVLWPAEGRFECADYFQPQERLRQEDLQQLVHFFEEARPQVDRGRYGLATYLKVKGPPFIRKLPRGYIVELVQLLLNKHVLVFRKGKVSYAPMGMNTMGTSFSEEKFAAERPLGEGMGPTLPPAMRRSIARLLRANTKLANEVTDDPVGVLSFLCSRAASPASGPGGKLRRVPMYHFEKSGVLHAPMWVCVVTVEVAGLGQQEQKIIPGSKSSGSLATKKPLTRSRMLRYKQYETPKKARKQEAHQEAALAILEEVYWNLAFNVCLDSIPKAAKRFKAKKVRGEQPGLAISPPPSLTTGSQQLGTVQPTPERIHLTEREVKERESMVEAVLNGTATDAAQEPALRLDRLLLALDQKPCVYDIEKKTSGWNQVKWEYSVNLQLRPRCNIFQISGDSKSDDWDSAFPALGTTSPPNPAPSTRYPAIEVKLSRPKRDDAKAVVAATVLQQISQYQSKLPLLFQVPQTLVPHSPPATSSSSTIPTPISSPSARVVQPPSSRYGSPQTTPLSGSWSRSSGSLYSSRFIPPGLNLPAPLSTAPGSSSRSAQQHSRS
eukprot:TRINITY_DN5068_c0_g1_i3.p1 TRINITY_DN5068_c0_g1~~TRINITY_DN5068_c0_g1_i3.p1  ORF type:complete len:986 (+),score=61.48 TRINITY_DN5068_c0_g1_i3:316-3273(+)